MGDPVRLRMNGETVELIPVRAAHTGGDTMIRFVNADAIMVGDFYRNFGYPFIDVTNGGSLKGALEALELTMKVAGPNTKLIPGHGTFINRKDIIPYRDMILAVQARVQQLIDQGKTKPRFWPQRLQLRMTHKSREVCCRQTRAAVPARTVLCAWCIRN